MACSPRPSRLCTSLRNALIWPSFQNKAQNLLSMQLHWLSVTSLVYEQTRAIVSTACRTSVLLGKLSQRTLRASNSINKDLLS